MGYGVGYGLSPVIPNDGVATASIQDSAVTTAKIADDNVTLDKLAELANATVIGRNTAGTGDPEAVTMAQLQVLLNAANGYTYSKVLLTADQVFATNTVADVTGALIAVTSGHKYKVKITVLVKVENSATGVMHTVTTPTLTHFALKTSVRNGTADAGNGDWQGLINTSGDVVTPAAGQTANEEFILTMDGFITPSANGNIQLKLGSEDNVNDVTHMQTLLELWDYGT